MTTRKRARPDIQRPHADPTSQVWQRGYEEGRNGHVCADVQDHNYLDGWLTGDQERYMEESKC